MDLTELTRRLDNLLRLGTIANVDHAKALVKVQSGNILTDWLPWLTLRAGTTQTWSPPTTGEQCLVLAVSGELTTAVVLVGLYTQNAPSHNPDEHCIKFADGAEIKYDHTSGHLSAKNCKTAEIHATQSITADTPSLTCTGNVTIDGTLTVQQQISGNGGLAVQGGSGASFSGNVKQKGGSFTTTDDVIANGISLKNHTHRGDSGGKTGTPT